MLSTAMISPQSMYSDLSLQTPAVRLHSQVVLPNHGTGVLRYVGPISGREGKGLFAGVELVGLLVLRGKNNGDVDGVAYFDVKVPQSGLFMPFSRLVQLNPSVLTDNDEMGSDRDSEVAMSRVLLYHANRVSRHLRVPTPTLYKQLLDGLRGSVFRPPTATLRPGTSSLPYGPHHTRASGVRALLSLGLLEVLENDRGRELQARAEQLEQDKRALEQEKQTLEQEKRALERALAQKDQALVDLQQAAGEYETGVAQMENELDELREELERQHQQHRHALQQKDQRYERLKLSEQEGKQELRDALTGLEEQIAANHDLYVADLQRFKQEAEERERRVEEFANTLLLLREALMAHNALRMADLENKLQEKIDFISSLSQQLHVLQDTTVELANRVAQLTKQLMASESRVVALETRNQELERRVAAGEDTTANTLRKSVSLSHPLPRGELSFDLLERELKYLQLESQQQLTTAKEIVALKGERERLLRKVSQLEAYNALHGQEKEADEEPGAGEGGAGSQAACEAVGAAKSDLPVYRPPQGASLATRELWCGLCEREGHESADCPYENEEF